MEEFPGYYQTGDAGYIDEDGYIFVMTRTDDIINVAGHRLSTGAMEEVLADHPDVAECAVIGVADQLKGQVPLGFLVLSAGVNRVHDEIVGEVVGVTGVFPPHAVMVVGIPVPARQGCLSLEPPRQKEPAGQTSPPIPSESTPVVGSATLTPNSQ